MIGKPEVLAMVLAGGEGSRLQPLTAGRSKPAVPFSGGTRIVDYVLSNLINSRMYAIYLLVQYKSQSLIEHVHTSWSLSSVIPGHFITIVPPQMREGPEWFQGTADAIYQNLNLIEQHEPEVVAVFGADHVYRMDVRQMLAFHRERRADVTVAALPVPVARASAFGIIGTEKNGRIRDFLEKPERPPAMPGRPGFAYASMGNYLFDTEVLKVALEEAREQGGTDFGRHMLPRLASTRRAYAYDFATNEVPGVKPYEEVGYWRDVGSLDAYFDAHQDLLGTEPRFDAFNPYWPIQSGSYVGPVARVLGGKIENAMIASGSRIEDALVRNTVLRYDVRIDPGAEVEDCVIMDHVHVKRGARLRRVIVDRYNTIEEGERIGYDHSVDARRFTVSPGGIVVVPRARSGGVPFSPVFTPRATDQAGAAATTVKELAQ